MDDNTTITKKQALLHVGRLRDQLEELAAVDGMRWQDLARAVLTNYVNGKRLEGVLK